VLWQREKLWTQFLFRFPFVKILIIKYGAEQKNKYSHHETELDLEVYLMIVRPADVPEKKAFGVTFKTLATGTNIMCTVMHYEKGKVVPFHKHLSEQVGYVIEGKLRLKIETEDLGIIQAGDSYLIRGNMRHSLEALEKSVVVDMFSPPREEYKNK